MKPAPVVLTCALAGNISAVPSAVERPGAPAAGPLTVTSARVSLEGTSKIHGYTASSSTVRLRRLEPSGAAYQAIGGLTVAGVEREVTLNLQVLRNGPALAVTGSTDLLMTDFGVTPPKAMLGMLKTNPKVQVRLELLLSSSSLT